MPALCTCVTLRPPWGFISLLYTASVLAVLEQTYSIDIFVCPFHGLRWVDAFCSSAPLREQWRMFGRRFEAAPGLHARRGRRGVQVVPIEFWRLQIPDNGGLTLGSSFLFSVLLSGSALGRP